MTELPDIGKQVDEKQTLLDFLNYQRTVLLRKTEGLTDEQACKTLPPSSLTLKGLLKHLTLVELHWAVYVVQGDDMPSPWAEAPWDDDPDWELTTAADDALADLQARYTEALAVADAIYDSMPLDQIAARPGDDERLPSLRWVLVHMIEEHARHLGHADFLRQAIDGAVGD